MNAILGALLDKDFVADFIEDIAKEDDKGVAVIYNTYINGGRCSIGFRAFILVI